jgi:hypothetical protein
MGLDEGKIIISNKEIFHGMSSESFINFFSTEVNSYVNGDIERYNFKSPQNINGLTLWLRIVFIKKSISSVELKNADPNLKNTYDNWSKDKLELKRKTHDEWLINQLGEPTDRKLPSIKYVYTWGEILSYLDPKGGDTGIVINYNNQDA